MLTLDPILYKLQAYGNNVPYYVYSKTSEWETFRVFTKFSILTVTLGP